MAPPLSSSRASSGYTHIVNYTFSLNASSYHTSSSRCLEIITIIIIYHRDASSSYIAAADIINNIRSIVIIIYITMSCHHQHHRHKPPAAAAAAGGSVVLLLLHFSKHINISLDSPQQTHTSIRLQLPPQYLQQCLQVNLQQSCSTALLVLPCPAALLHLLRDALRQLLLSCSAAQHHQQLWHSTSTSSTSTLYKYCTVQLYSTCSTVVRVLHQLYR